MENVFAILSDDTMVDLSKIVMYRGRRLYLAGLKEQYVMLTESEDKRLVKILERRGIIEYGESVF